MSNFSSGTYIASNGNTYYLEQWSNNDWEVKEADGQPWLTHSDSFHVTVSSISECKRAIERRIEEEKMHEYKASNGEIFIIHHLPDYTWQVEKSYLSHVAEGQPFLYPFIIKVSSASECITAIEQRIEDKRKEMEQRANRIAELKQAFEESGRKKSFADPSELDTLLNLTEKKIIQQCRRPQCHGCKMGWICPKFWSE